MTQAGTDPWFWLYEWIDLVDAGKYAEAEQMWKDNSLSYLLSRENPDEELARRAALSPVNTSVPAR